MEPTSAPARPLWDRIQAACAERGWNGVRLERESGVARQTVNKWRTQPRPPQAATVNAVASAVGIPLDEALRLAGILPGATPAAAPSSGEDRGKLTDDEVDELLERIRTDPAARERLLRAILAGHGHEAPSTDRGDDESAGHRAS